MRMDTETISYVLEGHELQNDVQTMIQVFLANRHYIRTDTVTDAEITVKSEMKEGIASAMLYRRGEKASAWSMEYDEKMLTEKELAAVPEELLEDLLRYSEYGWRERRIATLLARRYPVALTEADVRKLRRLGQKKLRQA